MLGIVAGVLAVLGQVSCSARNDETNQPPASGTPTAGTSDLDAVGVGRWRAGTTAFTDDRGLSWAPDSEVAQGGTVTTSEVAVTETDNPELYQAQRIGVESYDLPVASPGRYLVVFHLAETDRTPVGGRVFDLGADQTTLVAGIDVASWFGADRAGHVVAFVDTSTDRIDLDLTPSAGSPAVAAVSVSPVRLGATDQEPALLWSDEFDGRDGAAPSGDWVVQQGAGGWGNNELQYYTDRAANAGLDGEGNLVLRALREDYTGPDGVSAAFTSARLSTEDSFSFQYGHIETRARFPEGDGLLPAVWGMGTDLPEVNWPASGEIDVVETPVSVTGDIHGTVHGPDGSEQGYAVGGSRPPPTDMPSEFHTYALDWYPGVLSFSLDGTPYAIVTEADLAPEDGWVFDKPYFLLLSLAVGGDWPGEPAASATFPQDMVLDYVRVAR